MSSGSTGGQHRRLVWRRLALPAVLAAFAAVAVIYNLATPIFEGPDEIWHFAFASYLADGHGLPILSATQPDLWLRNAAHPPLYFYPIAALIAPIDRSDFPNSFHFNLASPSITPGSHSDRPNLLVHGRNEDYPYRQTTLAVHLGRIWSTMLGLVTLAGVWVVARQLAPGAGEWLPLAVTAMAAAVPQFVYGSALINNDALAASGGAWTLAALLALMRRRHWTRAVLAGVALGVTLLSKIGMVALAPLPLVALVLANPELWASGLRRPPAAVVRRCLRWTLVTGAIIYGTAAVIAGWWYMRNWLLYGDPLAWQIWQVLAGVGRPTPTLAQFLSDMGGLFGTFWADFGLRVDHQWVWVFAVLVLAAVAGWGRRLWRHDWAQYDAPGLLLGVTAFGLLLASAVRYSLQITDIHGRLLYPALAVAAFVVVTGLLAWGRRLGPLLVAVVIAALTATTVLVPFLVIGPAYARPLVEPSQLPEYLGQVTNQAFGGQVALIGYRLPVARLQPGQAGHLFTYWRLVAPGAPAEDLRANLALVRPDGQPLGHTEVLLGTSVYPSSQWGPADIIAAEIVVTPTASDLPTVADLWLSVRGASLDPLPAAGNSHVVMGRMVLAGSGRCAADKPTNADFGGQMGLTGYTLTSDRLTLCWSAEAAMAADYTVFVHVVDASGQGLGSADAQPRGGLFPTSAWAPGDVIMDEHALSSVPAGAQVRIGVYRLDTGERLSLADGSGTELELTR